MRRLRVAVITQEDKLFIPKNVELLCKDVQLDVRVIVVLNAKGSLDNMRRQLLSWFGPLAVAKVVMRSVTAGLLSALGKTSGTLKQVAARHGIPYVVERSANAPELLDRLRAMDLDCVVSYSAPQVFKKELLDLPRIGCINLHCSLLPQYRGLLPSFWVLYNGEQQSGATVHMMGAGIDDGAILGQVTVDIKGMRRMVDVLDATKAAGGILMRDVLRGLAANTVAPRPNPIDEGAYFKWPTKEQAREFRRRGYTLA